jgi:hypothetical protein
MMTGELLLAYHGCDVTTRDDLVTRRIDMLDRSSNSYDWLGPGIYFFENDLRRAMNFAAASAAHPGRLYTRRPIATPAAVGAVLCVRSCLDMSNQAGLNEFSLTLSALRQAGTALASNDAANPLLRRLNNQVFAAMHALRATGGNDGYDIVRSAFVQGAPLGDPHSGFNQENHIQLAVLNADAIVGWFMPAGSRLMNPDEYHGAQQRLSAMGTSTARKPRVRSFS